VGFILLNDPGGQRQRLVRVDHISAAEISKSDQSVTLFLLGGQEIHLSHEESKQFVQHTKSVMRPTENASAAPG
jgi:hypothetical protein